MSKFTPVDNQIRDLVALVYACFDLKLTLVPGSTCRGAGGTLREAAYVIRLRGPHDIAVDFPTEKGGTYTLTTDWSGGHVAHEVGAGCARLLEACDFHQEARLAAASQPAPLRNIA